MNRQQSCLFILEAVVLSVKKGTGIRMKKKADVLIVGSGAAGLFCALHLPRDKKILIISKDDAKNSDSYLAQGGICVLKSEDDYASYFEDTMKAGHHENRKESVEIMIRSSRKIIDELILYGVDFENDHGSLIFTREGGHSTPRILFHEDATGKEITSKLLRAVQQLPNLRAHDNDRSDGGKQHLFWCCCSRRGRNGIFGAGRLHSPCLRRSGRPVRAYYQFSTYDGGRACHRDPA